MANVTLEQLENLLATLERGEHEIESLRKERDALAEQVDNITNSYLKELTELANINYRLRLDYPRENAETAADAINDAVRHIREFHGLLATEYRCAKVLDLIEQYASQVRG